MRRKDRDAALLARRLAHVHDADVRHPGVVGPLGQLQERVFAAAAIIITFERRCGGAEHHGGAFHLAAHDGHVARVVTRRFFLLVSVLVFLVHDDQAQRIYGRKNRRARADDNARATLANLVPLVVPLAGG